MTHPVVPHLHEHLRASGLGFIAQGRRVWGTRVSNAQVLGVGVSGVVVKVLRKHMTTLYLDPRARASAQSPCNQA